MLIAFQLFKNPLPLVHYLYAVLVSCLALRVQHVGLVVLVACFTNIRQGFILV